MQKYIVQDDIFNLLGHFLDTESVLLTHSSNNGNQQILTRLELLLDLLTKFTFGKLDVALGITRISDDRDESILNIDKLVFLTDDHRHCHVVGGRRDVFVLLSSENVNTDQVDLGRAVLSGLAGAHVDNLTGTTRDDDESVLTEGRALHWDGLGGSRGGLLESFIFFVRHL